MNTSRSVAKLRKEAAEKKAELRRQKEIFNKERATHWIPHTEKKKKRSKSANKPKTREEYEAQQRKQSAADDVLRRLLQDTKVRQIQKEQIQAANPNAHEEFNYNAIIRNDLNTAKKREYERRFSKNLKPDEFRRGTGMFGMAP